MVYIILGFYKGLIAAVVICFVFGLLFRKRKK